MFLETLACKKSAVLLFFYIKGEWKQITSEGGSKLFSVKLTHFDRDFKLYFYEIGVTVI